jgi:ATP/maltotriose-dependent transcriptional regulator MalT
VVAGPGWGKSTFIRRVASVTRSVEVIRPPSGWTSFALTRALFDAIGAAGSEELPAYTSATQEDQAAHAAALAAGFAAVAAERITEDTVVLLDDADWPAGDPLSVFLETLVLHLPVRLHLVVAARTAPALRIARLRAAGEVLKVGHRRGDRRVAARRATGHGARPPRRLARSRAGRGAAARP